MYVKLYNTRGAVVSHGREPLIIKEIQRGTEISSAEHCDTYLHVSFIRI